MIKGVKITYKEKELTVAIYEQQIWFSCSDIQEIIEIDFFGLYYEETADLNIDGNVMQMISEFGAYRLLCSANNETAKKFRKWLIGDAIYRLRKYGCYKLSIAEQKEKLINEIVGLKGNHSEVDKFKFFTLGKLKFEKALLEKMAEQQKKEKEQFEKRKEIIKDFPFSSSELEDDYDINLAITNLSWAKENLDEYMVSMSNNECWFNHKFVQYLKDGDYGW
jgi:prophage antirepressor-like protein